MDSLILTSLSRIPESSPNEAVSGLFKEVVETLRARGNVLLPIAPTGILYDLFEYMIQQVDQVETFDALKFGYVFFRFPEISRCISSLQ